MTREEVTACESGTPVLLADGMLGVLIFDGRVTNMSESLAAVRLLTGAKAYQHRAVPILSLVDLRSERGALVEVAGLTTTLTWPEATALLAQGKGTLTMTVVREPTPGAQSTDRADATVDLDARFARANRDEFQKLLDWCIHRALVLAVELSEDQVVAALSSVRKQRQG